MPRVKPGPYKWAIYYTWVPLRMGPKGKEWIELRTFINSWWSLDAWSDREYCALYDTKEEAEKDAAEIVASDPGMWAGIVHVAPTQRKFGEEKIVSVIRAEEARREEEQREADRRFQEWYEAETKRIDKLLKATGWTVKGKT